jgi:hypothetical protein
MAYSLTDTDAAVVVSARGDIIIALPAHNADDLVEGRFLDCIAIGEMLGAGNAELRALIEAHINAKSAGVQLQ